MDSIEIKLADRDDLRLVRFLASDAIMTKPGKFLLRFLLLIYVITAIVYVVYFVTIPEARFITLNFPLFCLSISGALASLVFACKGSYVTDIKEINLWSNDSTGIDMKIKIKREYQQLSRFVICNTTLIVVVSILMALPGMKTYDFWLPFALMKKIPEPLRYMGGIALRLIAPIYIYPLVLGTYQSLYAGQHIISQMHMLNGYVKVMERGLNKNEQLLYDKETQNVIHARLIFCIKRYLHVFGYFWRKKQETNRLIPLFSMGAFFSGIGCVVHVYNTMYYSKDYLATLTATVIYVYVFCAMINMGQSLEEASGQIFHSFINTKWYAWDARNKGLLLMFLPMLRPLKSEFTKDISVNYGLGVRIVKVMYSVSAMLFRVKPQ